MPVLMAPSWHGLSRDTKIYNPSRPALWLHLKIPAFTVNYHHPSDEDKRAPQPGFFDLDERCARLNERDPLVKLNQIIVVLMFKILVLKHRYNVCDDDIE